MIKSINLSQFSNEHVRALVWCIGSSPLMNSNPFKSRFNVLDNFWTEEQLQLHEEWFLELDENPSPIEVFMEGQPSKLLGKVFESYIHFWISESPFFRLMDAQKVLYNGKTTIGEIDFIFQDLSNGEVYHLEVACKFYLGYNRSAQWKDWIGPNGNDSLQEKMTKLDRQLSILETPSGVQYLSENRWTKPIPSLLLRGYFFHHYSNIIRPLHPKFSNKNYNAGWYIHLNELNLLTSNESKWIIIPKSNWLTSLWEMEMKPLDSIDLESEVKRRMNKVKKAIMVAQVHADETQYEELSRGFIVLNSWPR